LKSLKRIAAFSFLLTLAAGCTRADEPTPVRLPDGRRLSMYCEGHGSPTVLLEAGFGATLQAWAKVQPVLARKTRVCAYDRAGYGLSDPGPLPRDGAAIAKDLDEALTAARIAGPFIVVGHSAGGLYVRLFADRRPRDVVGMVLVDPSVDHQDRQLSMFGPGAGSLAPSEATAQRCLDLAEGRTHEMNDGQTARCYDHAGKVLPAGLWRTELSELQTLWGATSDEVVSGRTFYDAMPLIVLTASGTYKSVPEPARDLVDARWARLHEAIAGLSTRGAHQVVERSSHLIMIDRPDAVIDAVESVMKQAARPAPP
jgi:pimeloyl-ACP methyl ester carboxylesterase